MKLPEGMTIYNGHEKFRGECPDEVVEKMKKSTQDKIKSRVEKEVEAEKKLEAEAKKAEKKVEKPDPVVVK